MREMRPSSCLPGLISKIVNNLFPSHCPVCGSPSDKLAIAPFCGGCWTGIEKYSGPSCKICADPFSSKYAEICSACMKKLPFFSKVMSFGIYTGTLSEAINLFKFHGMKRLSKPLGKFLLDFSTSGIQAIVPVPLSVGGTKKPRLQPVSSSGKSGFGQQKHSSHYGRPVQKNRNRSPSQPSSQRSSKKP